MSIAAKKKALVDPYAQIALHDSAENQRVVMRDQILAEEKKGALPPAPFTHSAALGRIAPRAALCADRWIVCARAASMKKALDAQVRYQQQVIIKEREEDREWLHREQARIKVWNEEEKKKIEETKAKNERIREQREQQLRELAMIRAREQKEQQAYDLGILRDIREHITMEKAKEAMKKASDAENLRRVAEQNIEHQAFLKAEKAREAEAMRALEAQWSEVLDKQERQRDRQLKMTYSRQALSYGTAASMQEVMDRIAREDEARAEKHARELEEAAAKREADQIAERRRLQQETLDVLSIQVREKAMRSSMDREREAMVAAREANDIKAAEAADMRRREKNRLKNEQYKAELMHQMEVQEERKVLAPYLMSKAERQMNAALLRRLPED